MLAIFMSVTGILKFASRLNLTPDYGCINKCHEFILFVYILFSALNYYSLICKSLLARL